MAHQEESQHSVGFGFCVTGFIENVFKALSYHGNFMFNKATTLFIALVFLWSIIEFKKQQIIVKACIYQPFWQPFFSHHNIGIVTVWQAKEKSFQF